MTVIDLGPSPTYKRGHVPGSWFAIRARLTSDLSNVPVDERLVVTSPDDGLARFAAPEIARLSGLPVRVLEGGTQAWVAAGHPVETGFSRAASSPEDVYKRPYEGTDNAAEAMQAYLDWEFGLVDQLANDGTHGFTVI